MSFESHGEQIEELKGLVAELASIVSKQNTTLQKLNVTIAARGLECLDIVFHVQRQSIGVLKLIRGTFPKLDELTEKMVQEMFAELDANDKRIDAMIMNAKTQCIPLVPPLPPSVNPDSNNSSI